ncbi:MAG: hypothetical protein Q4Q53_02675 [Methanocorpusculum sp.]|nr:hypothetical protein [Methanocorpusculum sp.]
MAEDKEKELDSDFTKEEHEEFEKLESVPYKEVEEEKIRVPKREEKVTDTKNDLLYLALFCIAMGIFLMIIVFGGFIK